MNLCWFLIIIIFYWTTYFNRFGSAHLTLLEDIHGVALQGKATNRGKHLMVSWFFRIEWSYVLWFIEVMTQKTLLTIPGLLVICLLGLSLNIYCIVILYMISKILKFWIFPFLTKFNFTSFSERNGEQKNLRSRHLSSFFFR